MLDQNLGQTQSQKDQKQEDLYFYTQSWVWRAIEALVLAKDFDPSPRAIATRLNVSVEAAVDALDGLVRLGCIERTGGTFTRNPQLNAVTPQTTSKEHTLNAHTNLANQMIAKLNSDSFYKNQICLGSVKLIKENLPKIAEFFKTMDQEGRNEVSPGIVSIEFSVSCVENQSQNGAYNA